MSTRNVMAVAVSLLIVFQVSTAIAQVRLPFLFSDGMVLQRDKQIPVWGWAEAGQEITIQFGEASLVARADSTGSWRLTLPAMAAGAGPDMVVRAGAEEVVISDILVGDVWVCSGQSNMEWPVSQSLKAEVEMARANDLHIRHFKVPHSWSWTEEEQLDGGAWEAAEPSTVGDFTAVGYFFAREMRKRADVPIGLINTSWGGSRLEPWMSAHALGYGFEDADAVRLHEEEREAQLRADLEALIGELPTEDRGIVDGEPIWAHPDIDDSDWDTLYAPAPWEQGGYVGLDGIGWYRKTFELTDSATEFDIDLGLGMIDDSDIAWVNGVEVGRTEMAWNEPRVYRVESSALRAGPNVIAIRVEDTGGGGGIHGDPGLMYLNILGHKRSLAGDWQFKVGAASVAMESRKNHVPTVLFNKMVHPFVGFPMTGVLWYQGESNAGLDDALLYRDQFANMITQWRSDWGMDDFPFLFVQLANFEAEAGGGTESGWAVLRESQSAVLTLPNTAQAVTIDIGEAGDIHPRNKQDVGLRLSLAARKFVHNDAIVFSGPVYVGHEVQDGRVILAFDHVGGGLSLREHPSGLSGFEIAGEDGVFFPAEAVVEGEAVVVSSTRVPDPLLVRYAWDDDPAAVTLYNVDGLPASPFRTDLW